MTMETLEERQAGRITEIQNTKIGLRKLGNEIMAMRITDPVATARLRIAEFKVDEAIDALDAVKREDL